MKKPKHFINVQKHLNSSGEMSSELREFLSEALIDMQKKSLDHKQPPWMAFPKYERISMGWRMGSGEDYWLAFHRWVRALDKVEFDEFVRTHPEPENWAGFYDDLNASSWKRD